MDNPCAGCFLRNRTRVPYEGPIDALYAVVGEAPGVTECRARRPFHPDGPSGRLLTTLLTHLGIDRADVRIGNAILCGPISDTDKQNPAFKDVLARCALRREAEGDLGSARTILAAGSMAANGLLGETITLGGRQPRRGALHRDAAGRAVFPTWHPAAILRSGGDNTKGGKKQGGGLSDAEVETLAFDIERSHDFALGRREEFTPEILTTRDPVLFVNWVRENVYDAGAMRFSFDVETDSVDPTKADLLLVGLAVELPNGVIRAVSFWWPNADDISKLLLADLLSDANRECVLQNCQYDLSVAERKVTVPKNKVIDTLLAMHAAFPEVKLDLGSIAHTFLAIEPWKFLFRQWERAHKQDVQAKSDEWIARNSHYNAMDAATTLAVVKPLFVECEKRKVLQIHDLDVQLALIARKMTERGLYISPEIRGQLRDEFQEKERKALDKLRNLVVDGVLNALTIGKYPKEIEQLLMYVQKSSNKSLPKPRWKKFKVPKKPRAKKRTKALTPEQQALVAIEQVAAAVRSAEAALPAVLDDVSPWDEEAIARMYSTKGPLLDGTEKLDGTDPPIPRADSPSVSTTDVSPPASAVAPMENRPAESPLGGESMVLSVPLPPSAIPGFSSDTETPQAPNTTEGVATSDTKTPKATNTTEGTPSGVWIYPPIPEKVWTNKAWNPFSTNQLRLAFDICGVQLPANSLTKSGQRSMSKHALVQVFDHPLVGAVIESRKYRRFLSVYFESEGSLIGEDNRLRVGWKVHGTPTGRWSSGAGGGGVGDIGIAVQNWPPIMRKMVVAPEGYLLVGADYNALEFRMIALLSGEIILLEIFNNTSVKRDLHAENTARLYPKVWSSLDPRFARSPEQQKEYEERRKLMRKFVKTGFYAAVYGAVPPTVQATLRAQSLKETDAKAARMLREVSLKDCKMFVDAVPRFWPRLARWRDQQVVERSRSGIFVSPIDGRRRVWLMARSERSAFINTPVQMSSGSLMNQRSLLLIPKLHALSADIHPTLQVHDSWTFEVPIPLAEQAKKIVEETMTTTLTIGAHSCLFPVEAAIGKSWDVV